MLGTSGDDDQWWCVFAAIQAPSICFLLLLKLDVLIARVGRLVKNCAQHYLLEVSALAP